MKKIGITYGTYDLLHNGHIRLLERAKQQVDFLIVGVTSDPYDYSRGKMNVRQTQDTRIEQVKETGIADLVISEDYLGQKIDDIIEYKVDIFIIGDDWVGQFDYLKEYTEVTYLERTKDISSTQIRETNNTIVQLGVAGTGRIAHRFVKETRYVSGVHINAVFSESVERAQEFSSQFDLNAAFDDFDKFLDNIDAVYIAKEHKFHYPLAKAALLKGKHVLLEKPMVLKSSEAQELFDIAKTNNITLKEAIKTAYCPGFKKVIELCKSGTIGKIINVESAFTSIRNEPNSRELDPEKNGGSLNEFGSYTLLPIIKTLGAPLYISTKVNWLNGVDSYLKVEFEFPGSKYASMVTALNAKAKGDLRITGTHGFIYVPDPWWKTTEIQVCFENSNQNQTYHYNFDDDGLRYEISEFIKSINDYKNAKSITSAESLMMVDTMEQIRNNLAQKWLDKQNHITQKTLHKIETETN